MSLSNWESSFTFNAVADPTTALDGQVIKADTTDPTKSIYLLEEIGSVNPFNESGIIAQFDYAVTVEPVGPTNPQMMFLRVRTSGRVAGPPIVYDTQYGVTMHRTEMRIFTLKAGAFAFLNTGGVLPATTWTINTRHTFRLKVTGAKPNIFITIFIDDVEVKNAFDGDAVNGINSGSVGWGFSNTPLEDIYVDDFKTFSVTP